MRKSKEEALRWIRQAEYNLRVAENNHNAKFYSASCFMCEQAAQLALKAYIIFKTGRPVLGVHSVKKLAEDCLRYDGEFKQIIEFGKVLDRYYIPTRYPDAIAPPSIPCEIYTERDSEEAIRIVREIILKVKKEIEGR